MKRGNWGLIAMIILSRMCLGIVVELTKKRIEKDYTIEWSKDMMELSYDLYTLKVCIGTPNDQCFDITPAVQSSYTIIQGANIDRQGYNQSLSKSFENMRHFLSFNTHQLSLSGQVVSDKFTITQQYHYPHKTFNFLLLNHYDTIIHDNINGYLGLSQFYTSDYIFNHIDSSFIDHLYNESMIHHKTFVLNYTKEGGTIEFGRDLMHYPQCYTPVCDILHKEWNCMVKMIKINDQVHNITSNKIYFDSISSLIVVPVKMESVIFDTIISIAGGKQCYKRKEENRIVLHCDISVDIGSFPDILLTLGDNVELKLQWKNMFKEMEDDKKKVYVSTLVIHNDRINEWKIGIPGFIDNIIGFNRETFSIAVIPKSNHIPIFSSNPCIRNALIILMVNLLCGLIILKITNRKLNLNQFSIS